MQLTKQSANTSMAFECYVDSILYKLRNSPPNTRDRYFPNRAQETSTFSAYDNAVWV